MVSSPTSPPNHSQLTGAAGEALAQAHLLVRGWIAGNINASVKNNAGFDLTATKDGHTLTIAVKTIGRGSTQAQWSGTPGKTASAETIFRGETRPDFVVFVWFVGDGSDPMEHRVFVVPAGVVDRDVLRAHRHWFQFPKRDGGERKQGGHIAIGFLGRDTETNIANGFAEKWQKYEGAWGLLEKH